MPVNESLLVVSTGDLSNLTGAGGAAAKRDAIALVAQNPAGAMARLKESKESGLSLTEAAAALDEILATVSPEEGRQLMEDHLTPGARVELIAARSDLPSVAAHIGSIEDVIAAMLADFGDPDVAPATVDFLFTLKVWAGNLKDREDWGKILDSTIYEGRTFRWFLLLSIWNDADRPALLVLDDEPIRAGQLDEFGNEVESVEPSDLYENSVLIGMFDEYGLDPVSSLRRLQVYLQSRDVPVFDRLRQQRVARQQSEVNYTGVWRKGTEVEEAQAVIAVKQAADELDL